MLDNLARREFLKFSAAGAALTSASGWLDLLAARAADLGARHKSCILLWMEGGPTQRILSTSSPAPRMLVISSPLPLSVPGIQISEHFPKFARQIHAAILRGMSTSEAPMAGHRHFMHTGYREGLGGLFTQVLAPSPRLNSARRSSCLPNFVSVGGKLSYGSGFLGTRHQPLVITDPTRASRILHLQPAQASSAARVKLLEELSWGSLASRRQTLSMII